MATTPQEFNQNDVFLDGQEPDDEVGMFNANAAASSAGKPGAGAQAKKEKKEILGLTPGLWLMILGSLVFVAFVVGRVFVGGSSAADDGMGQIEPVADASMSLEGAAAQQAPAGVQDEALMDPQVAPPAPAAVIDPAASVGMESAQTAPVVAAPMAASNPDAADLAAPAGPQVIQAVPAPTPGGQVVIAAAPAPALSMDVPPASGAVVEQLQRQAAVRDAEVARLNQRMAGLEARISELAAKPTQAAAPSPAPAARPAAARRSQAPVARAPTSARPRSEEASKASAPITGVSLRAIVPDVAWVQTSAGESLQVRSGDVIPGVGTVKSINADSASVQLTDGRTLK